MWRDFSNAFREVWQASAGTGGSYRPDLYYMRGPGPKWHAKHTGFLAATLPSVKTAAIPQRRI